MNFFELFYIENYSQQNEFGAPYLIIFEIDKASFKIRYPKQSLSFMWEKIIYIFTRTNKHHALFPLLGFYFEYPR